MKRLIGVIAGSLLVGSVWAQSASQPLNLKLPPAGAMPPSDLPASSASSAKPAGNAPGVYYGDTSGKMGQTGEIARATDCDDSTYNQPQVHGAVSTGVMTGSHIGTGTFNAGEVNVSKRYGSCDDPSGGVSFSIRVGESDFHGRGRGH